MRLEVRSHRRVSEVCFSHRASVVIRHTSQFGPFWKRREHVVISSWFGIVGSVFFQVTLSVSALARGTPPASVKTEGDVFARGFLSASVSSEGDFPKCAASSSTTSSENSSRNLNIVPPLRLRARGFLWRGLDSHPTMELPIAFVTAMRNTKMFGAAFGGLLSFR